MSDKYCLLQYSQVTKVCNIIMSLLHNFRIKHNKYRKSRKLDITSILVSLLPFCDFMKAIKLFVSYIR